MRAVEWPQMELESSLAAVYQKPDVEILKKLKTETLLALLEL